MAEENQGQGSALLFGLATNVCSQGPALIQVLDIPQRWTPWLNSCIYQTGQTAANQFP